jgi:N4-gp56 family major capsid protein
MARTVVGVNSPLAIKRNSAALAADTPKQSYFDQRFVGEGEPATLPIQRLTELESDQGEQITFDLSVQLKQQPIEGDNTQEGTEEGLEFYQDNVYIDQQRCGVDGGGRMTRKRTLHKMRDIGRRRMAEWWARLLDEIRFIYLSGSRGVNSGFIYPAGWTGRANNTLSTPDSAHLMLPRLGTFAAPGNVTTKSTLVVTDATNSMTSMNLNHVDRFVAMAGTMGGGLQEVPRIQPIKINGAKKYVLVMHDWQEFDMRTSSATGQWLDIQKALATSLGKESPIVKGGLGEYNDVVLHKHENVIRFSDYGVGTNLPAARALFLGTQALTEAYGSPGTDMRFDWFEKMADNNNRLIISSSCIWGCKKVTFNGLDYGVVAFDTYAKDPNA